jgi:hypothetical protein
MGLCLRWVNRVNSLMLLVRRLHPHMRKIPHAAVGVLWSNSVRQREACRYSGESGRKAPRRSWSTTPVCRAPTRSDERALH